MYLIPAQRPFVCTALGDPFIDSSSSIFVQREFHIAAKNRPDNVAVGDDKKSAARHCPEF
jgi:hypothetical protein